MCLGVAPVIVVFIALSSHRVRLLVPSLLQQGQSVLLHQQPPSLVHVTVRPALGRVCLRRLGLLLQAHVQKEKELHALNSSVQH
jgi:hypothetical protein